MVTTFTQAPAPVVALPADPRAELDVLLAEDVVSAQARERSAFDGAAGERAGSIVLFGAGGLGQRTLAGLRLDGVEPLAFADNNELRWGTVIEGLPVLSPAEAARRHGDSAVFVVTIWGAGSTHRYADSEAQLHGLGADVVVPVAWLAWRHPERLLPFYALNLPSKMAAHDGSIRRAYELLSDDESRRQYVDQVRWRLTGDPGCLSHPVTGPHYLVTDVARPIDAEVVLDCGAYDGDTLQAWLTERGPTFARYLALEPDPANLAALERLVASLPDAVGSRIVALPYAAAARAGTAVFSAMGTASSALGNDGEGLTVTCAAIDDVLAEVGGPAPTFVKMDIEGAELGALAGASCLIRDHGPMLALATYHRQDHLWRVLLAAYSLRPDYSFFLRPHNEEGWDLVLYAVPPARVPVAATVPATGP